MRNEEFFIFKLLHRHHRPASILDTGKVEHGACLVRIVVLGAHGNLGKERKRAFRAYHQVGNNIERVVEADEWQEIQSGYVLDGIFVADACGEFFVGTYPVAQFADAVKEIGVGGFEGSTRNVVPCIQHGAVRQYDAGGEKYLVTIGMCAAIHARGVVHDDAAYHGRFHACRVRSKLTSVGRENLVDPLADDARLQGDLFMIGRNAVLLPVLSGYDQDRVTNGLSRQTGSCGTKRYWQTVTVGKSQQVGDFLFAVGTNHDLWDQTVETRICSPC